MNALLDEKIAVPSDFDDVAGTYDFLTGANPGYHRHLRMSAERLRAGRAPRILDLCCGTGASTEALRTVYPNAEIVGLDASAGMLARAQNKPKLGATFFLGDATDPVAAGVEGTFDAIFMAYGIRNIPDAEQALDNVFHLLKPGGVVCFHEYSVAESSWAHFIWNLVCFLVILPGGVLTGSGIKIYDYLRRSVNAFDGVMAFEARLKQHGFVHVRTEAMDGWQRGILHSFLATRPESGA